MCSYLPWPVAVIVQRVVMPTSGAESWTVLDDDFAPVAPPEDYLAYLAAIERSPNTVRAYASSLKLWFEFLGLNCVAWEAAGVPLAAALVAWRRVGRGAYKPFLHHATKGREIPTRPIAAAGSAAGGGHTHARAGRRGARGLRHLRDRFLLALLAETGMRVGQALGLRHSDFVSRERTVRIVPRADNADGARAKTRATHSLPALAPLVRLYSKCMHVDYGDLDSDYVLVNLWAEPLGRAMRYQAVAALVRRLRARSGVEFNLHMLRHTRATEWLRQGCRSRWCPSC